MTIPVQTTFTASIANGVTTVFPYAFKITAAEDLSVLLDGVLVTVGFTVSGVGAELGGNITFAVAPANGVNVLRALSPIFKRTTDYQQFGDWTADVVNNDFDRIWLALQSIQQNFTRSLKLPIDTATDQTLTEGAAARIGKLVSFDPSGNMTLVVPADISTTTVSAFMADLLDDATAADALVTLGAGVAVQTNAATAKTTPVDADELPLADSAASFGLKKLAWANLKATLKAYFDPIYTPRGFIDGAILSTAGSSSTMSVSAGVATDSTNAVSMTIAAIAKTTGAWAVGTGNGGKMSAAALAAGWYHFYAIRRPDTGVVDVGFDTSPTAPTLPTNYTQFRRIGSAKNDGTNWIRFFQNGDEFAWTVPAGDVNVTTPGTAAALRALTVPTGISVVAFGNVLILNAAGAANGFLIADPATTNTTTSATAGGNPTVWAVSSGQDAAEFHARTNTSAQVNTVNATANADVVRITTRGWIDSRGKDA